MSSFFKKLKSLASPSLKRKKSKSNQSLSSLNTSSCAQIYQVKEKDLPKLHLAAWKGDVEKCRQYAKADKINSIDKEGRTALHLACDSGNLDIVRLLCEEGADLNKRDRDGRTAFFVAVINAYFEIVELIYNYLDNKISVSMTDIDNSTCLHYASACKNINLLKFLINTKQFSINVPDKNNYTPLHIAVHSKNYEAMKLLIANNAQIDVTDDHGRTPLILAVMQSDTISMKVLLDSGCQKFVRDDDDKSAEDYAKGKTELLDLLKGGKIQSKSFTTGQDKKAKFSQMQSLSFSENSQLFKPAKQKSHDEANDQETLHTNREFSELDEKFNNVDTWNDSDGESDMIVEAVQPPKIVEQETKNEDIQEIHDYDEYESNKRNTYDHILIPTNNDYDENSESLSNRQTQLKQQQYLTKTPREENSESWMDDTDSYLKQAQNPKQNDKTASFITFQNDSKEKSQYDDGSWLINVHTSNIQNSSTDCQVFIQVFGTKGKSTLIQLEDESNKKKFQKGSIDQFIIVLPGIGSPSRIIIGHDDSGDDSTWHCEKVVLKHLKTQEEFIFNCNQWINSEVELSLQKEIDIQNSWNSSEDEEDLYSSQQKKQSSKLSPTKLNEIYEDIVNETQTSATKINASNNSKITFAELNNKKVNTSILANDSYATTNLSLVLQNDSSDKNDSINVIDFLLESYLGDSSTANGDIPLTDFIKLNDSKMRLIKKQNKFSSADKLNTSLIDNTMNLIKDESIHVVHADLSNLSYNEQQDIDSNVNQTIANKLINFAILKNNDIVKVDNMNFKEQELVEQQPPQISDIEDNDDDDVMSPMTTFANIIVSSNRQQVQEKAKLIEFTDNYFHQDDIVDLDFEDVNRNSTTNVKQKKSPPLKKSFQTDLIPDRPHHGVSNASEGESSNDENEYSKQYGFPLPSAELKKQDLFFDDNNTKDDALVDLILHPQLESPKREPQGLKELMSGLRTSTTNSPAKQSASLSEKQNKSKSVLDGLVIPVSKNNISSDISEESSVNEKIKKFEKMNSDASSKSEQFSAIGALVSGITKQNKLDTSFNDSTLKKPIQSGNLSKNQSLDDSAPQNNNQFVDMLISNAFNKSKTESNEDFVKKGNQYVDILISNAFKVNTEETIETTKGNQYSDKPGQSHNSSPKETPNKKGNQFVDNLINNAFKKDTVEAIETPKKGNQFVDNLINNAFKKDTVEAIETPKKGNQFVDNLINNAFKQKPYDSPSSTRSNNLSSFSQLNDRISQNLMRRDSDKFNKIILQTVINKHQDDDDSDNDHDDLSSAAIEPPYLFKNQDENRKNLAEIERINKQLEDALRTRNNLELELKKSRDKTRELDAELVKTKELLNKIEQVKNEAESSLDKSDLMVKTHLAEIRKLRLELSEIKETKESLEHEIAYVKQLHHQQESNFDNEPLNDDYNHLKHENNKFKIEIDILKQKIVELTEDRNQLSLLRDELTQQLEKSQLEVENRQEALEKALIQFNIEKALLKEENLKAKNEIVEIGKSKIQLKNEVDVIKGELILNKQELEKLQKEKFQLELFSDRNKTDYQNAKLKYESEIGSYKAQQLQLLEKLSQIEAKLISSENEIKYNKELVNEKQLQFEKCVEELQKVKSELNNHENIIGKEKEEKIKLQAQNESIKERLQQIVEENIALKKKQEELVNTQSLERAHTSSLMEIEKKKASSELEVNFLKRDLESLKQKLQTTETELALVKNHQKPTLDESFSSANKRQSYAESHTPTNAAYFEESKKLKQEVEKLKTDFNRIINMYDGGTNITSTTMIEHEYPTSRYKVDIPSLITQTPLTRSLHAPLNIPQIQREQSRTAIIVPNCEIILTRRENDAYLEMLRNEISKSIEIEVAKERPLLNLNTTNLNRTYEAIFEKTMNNNLTSKSSSYDLLGTLRSKYLI